MVKAMEPGKKSSCNSKQIALIACSKTKRMGTHKAKDLYQGELFKKSFEYCSKNYSRVFILSAKYGLLDPDSVISYYDETLKTKTEADKKNWAEKIIKQIHSLNIDFENIICFAGKDYNKYLPCVKFFNQFKNFAIGKQLNFYKRKLSVRRGLFYE